MPKLSSLQIFDKIEERLRDLQAGKEIEAREINVLLTLQQRQQLKASWQAQQKLRNLKRPIAFIAYEAKHKNAVAWIYKCHKLASKTRAERVKLLTAQTKCAEALTQAHATANKLVKSKPNNAVWFDRELDETLCVDELSESELATNNWLLLHVTMFPEQLSNDEIVVFGVFGFLLVYVLIKLYMKIFKNKE